METHAEVIDALGGGTELAAALSKYLGKEIDRESVYKWKTNGIPWKYRTPIAVLADRKGVEVPKDFGNLPAPGGPLAEAQ